jgi:hypothetical protein
MNAIYSLSPIYSPFASLFLIPKIPKKAQTSASDLNHDASSYQPISNKANKFPKFPTLPWSNDWGVDYLEGPQTKDVWELIRRKATMIGIALSANE